MTQAGWHYLSLVKISPCLSEIIFSRFIMSSHPELVTNFDAQWAPGTAILMVQSTSDLDIQHGLFSPKILGDIRVVYAIINPLDGRQFVEFHNENVASNFLAAKVKPPSIIEPKLPLRQELPDENLDNHRLRKLLPGFKEQLQSIDCLKPDGSFFCTFANCFKTFNDGRHLKSHEFNVHPTAPESWKCLIATDSRRCHHHFTNVHQFRKHLEADHDMTDEGGITRWLKDCYIARDYQGPFWCGACEGIIPQELKGGDMSLRRYKHVLDCQRLGMGAWEVLEEVHLTKSETRALRQFDYEGACLD